MELVDGVVGEVNAGVPQVLLVLILDGSESDKALLEHVHKERVERGDGHVQAQVALVAVHQQRRLDIAADQGGLIHRYLINLVRTGQMRTSMVVNSSQQQLFRGVPIPLFSVCYLNIINQLTK